jgi:hypothetical protein
VSKKAEISDFEKTLWQDMKQKSTNELTGIKGHFFDFIVIFPIPVGKSDAAVINGDDPIV